MEMIKSLTLSLLTVGVLAGCDAVSSPEPRLGSVSAAQQRWVTMPVLPIIQNAVVALDQPIDPQHNLAAMQQVCALARGEVTQVHANQALAQAGIDVGKITAKDSAALVLIGGDKAQRSTLCAAYMVKDMLSLPNLSEFTVTPTKKADGINAAVQFDRARLNQYLGVRLAVAMASADIFALIATELQRTPGLTLQAYNQRSQQLFAQLAPAYLTRVKAFYSLQGSGYVLTEASDQRFAFSSSNGSTFEYTQSGVIVRLNNIVWYGAGQLLGNTYVGQLAYFDPAFLGALDNASGRKAK